MHCNVSNDKVNTTTRDGLLRSMWTLIWITRTLASTICLSRTANQCRYHEPDVEDSDASTKGLGLGSPPRACLLQAISSSRLVLSLVNDCPRERRLNPRTHPLHTTPQVRFPIRSLHEMRIPWIPTPDCHQAPSLPSRIWVWQARWPINPLAILAFGKFWERVCARIPLCCQSVFWRCYPTGKILPPTPCFR